MTLPLRPREQFFASPRTNDRTVSKRPCPPSPPLRASSATPYSVCCIS